MNRSVSGVDDDCGLLLVAHGTRNDLGQAQFLWLAQRLSERLSPQPVEPAFLELAEPTIDQGVGNLLDRGARRLFIAPLLLFAAGHAKEDVPSAVRAALDRRGRSDIPLAQTAHFGCHEALLALSQRRLEEAAGWEHAAPAGRGGANCCHLLVGRGSSDATATAEMHAFGRLRGQATGLATEVAFLAVAKPSLADQLRSLAARDFQQIFVQPHLLFVGDLIDKLSHDVERMQAFQPRICWRLTPVLADLPGVAGPGSDLLEAVLLDRIAAVRG